MARDSITNPTTRHMVATEYLLPVLLRLLFTAVHLPMVWCSPVANVPPVRVPERWRSTCRLNRAYSSGAPVGVGSFWVGSSTGPLGGTELSFFGGRGSDPGTTGGAKREYAGGGRA